VAASKEQFYVSISRGKYLVLVFTDDREELLEAVHATSQRKAALDLNFESVEFRQPDPTPQAAAAKQVLEQVGNLRRTERESTGPTVPPTVRPVAPVRSRERLGSIPLPSPVLPKSPTVSREEPEPPAMEMEM
jgi:hypothetical protein